MGRKPSNAKKIEALRHAKKVLELAPIWSSLGICGALPPSNPATPHLRQYISYALKGKSYLSGWLFKYMPDLPLDRESMRKYRLQWIDWMIACLEGKEPAPPK